MRLADFVITAAVVAGLSAPAMAQQGSNQSPANQTAAPAPATYNNATYDDYGNHWVASAFVGTNFGTGFTGSTSSNPLGIDTSNTNSSINFGGQVAYLWGGYVGVEGLAEFSPSFEIADVFFENKPDINTYMANGIVAGHFGSENRYMPYFSVGCQRKRLQPTRMMKPEIISSGFVYFRNFKFGLVRKRSIVIFLRPRASAQSKMK